MARDWETVLLEWGRAPGPAEQTKMENGRSTSFIVLQLQRDIVSSNLPLYSYTSNSILIGPQIRF